MFLKTQIDLKQIQLYPLDYKAAEQLGLAIAAIDPWAHIGYEAEKLTNFLKAEEDALYHYKILFNNELSGVMTIRSPWLHGPYIQLLAILPSFQGQKIGSTLIEWLKSHSKQNYRNLWVIASKFNTNAIRFYERHGFTEQTQINDLVIDDHHEILFRIKLT